MRIGDYLIDQVGIDWPNVLASWHWLLPPDFTLWLVNRFGDLFIVLEDGTVHMLDVGGGTLKQVATDRDAFCSKLDEPEQANDWLMIPLVDALVSSGKLLGPGQCYSYGTLPVLGGSYTVENFVVKDLSFHYAAFGPMQESIKDLPDGTQVAFKVVP
jgi:hypothetical protein